MILRLSRTRKKLFVNEIWSKISGRRIRWICNSFSIFISELFQWLIYKTTLPERIYFLFKKLRELFFLCVFNAFLQRKQFYNKISYRNSFQENKNSHMIMKSIIFTLKIINIHFQIIKYCYPFLFQTNLKENFSDS
jgi:hypothetical protein